MVITHGSRFLPSFQPTEVCGEKIPLEKQAVKKYIKKINFTCAAMLGKRFCKFGKPLFYTLHAVKSFLFPSNIEWTWTRNSDEEIFLQSTTNPPQQVMRRN